ncbi:MAG: inner rane transporter RhtA [Pseudonocardiales bacterium]|nr:inner rane transporter RhtA [Pseudonocardiales bacterium]
MRSVPPEMLVLAGIGSVQFGAAFANELFDEAGPGGVVFLRLLLSAAILLAVARPTLRGRTRSDLLAVLAFGLVLGAMNWSFYEALHRLPLGVAVTIEFTGPLAVAVAGSRRLLDGLWVILAGAGVVLLALRGGHGDISAIGVLLALVAAACWALYILLSQRVGRTFARLDGLAIALGVGTLVVLPAGIAQGGEALLEGHVIAGGLGVALLSSLIPYSLELMALRRLTAYRFGLLMSLEPAVAALAGVVVLSQPLTAVLGVAVVLVAAASIGNTLTARRLPEPQPEA